MNFTTYRRRYGASSSRAQVASRPGLSRGPSPGTAGGDETDDGEEGSTSREGLIGNPPLEHGDIADTGSSHGDERGASQQSNEEALHLKGQHRTHQGSMSAIRYTSVTEHTRSPNTTANKNGQNKTSEHHGNKERQYSGEHHASSDSAEYQNIGPGTHHSGPPNMNRENNHSSEHHASQLRPVTPTQGSQTPHALPINNSSNANRRRHQRHHRRGSSQSSSQGQPKYGPLQLYSAKAHKTKANIKIGTINVGGAGGDNTWEKWSRICTMVQKEQLAILAIQETHLKPDRMKLLEDKYGRKFKFVHTTNPENEGSGGITVIINKEKLPTDKIKMHNIEPGRALLVEIPWRTNLILNTLVIYAPNDANENQRFWTELEKRWNPEHTDAMTSPRIPLPKVNIMLGDFNMVEDAIDRLPPHPDKESTVEALWDLKSTLKLSDGWRYNHPTPETLFTYTQRRQLNPSSSRIDRIYLDEENLHRTSSWESIYQSMTDHHLLKMKLTIPNIPSQGKGRWSLPIWLLEHKPFLKEIDRAGKELLKALESEEYVRTDDCNPQVLFQEFCNHTTEIAKKMNCENQSKLQTSLNSYRKQYTKQLNKIVSETQEEQEREEILSLMRDKIHELENLIQLQKTTAGSANYRQEGEDMTKYWFQFGKETRTRDIIYELYTEDETSTSNSKKMAQAMRDYHERIQLKDLDLDQDEREQAIENTLNFIKTAEPESMNKLGKKLTHDEVSSAIQNSPKGKAPGLDGIPSEFYRKLHERWTASIDKNLNIAEILRLVYNDVEEHGVNQHTPEFLEGWLCPIYKDGDRRNPANYRPITVLNTCYKIFTSALNVKLKEVIPRLINEDQAGFIPGRSIMDQIDLAHIMVELCETKEQNGIILLLDQEKAYDRIRHDYLWQVLEKNGFPQSFIKTVRALYTNANTSVMVNGELSTTFSITRGVRQGDPISCLLFNLAIEPLAESIRKSIELQGLTIAEATEEARRLIVSLFADDTTVYLSENNSYSDLKAVLDTWCLAAGARFNVKKTKVVPVGTKEYREQVATSRKINQATNETLPDEVKILKDGESARLLGSQIGNKVDQMGLWAKVIDKVSVRLGRWERTQPTQHGRTIIIQSIVGGITQYFAAAQGMPKSVEKILKKMSRTFFWADDKVPTVAEDALHLPVSEGGWNLLDIPLRNRAINTLKLKKLTDFSSTRPAWADAANELIIASIPASLRQSIDVTSVHQHIIQTAWKPTTYSKSLSPRLSTLLEEANKNHLTLEPNFMAERHKLDVPAWHHPGTKAGTRGNTNLDSSVCLRRNHGVVTTEDLLLHAEQYDHTDHKRSHQRRCKCAGCESAKSAGCRNPNLCFKAAKKLMDNLEDDFDPRKHQPQPPMQLNAATLDLLQQEDPKWVLFDKSRENQGNLGMNFRIKLDRENPITYQEESLDIDPDQEDVDEIIPIAISGLTHHAGQQTAKSSCGIWYGDGDMRNWMMRVPPNLQNTTNIAQMLAIHHIAKSSPGGDTLCIMSNSKWAITILTSKLENSISTGLVNHSGSDLIQATIAFLKARRGNTLFRLVSKGELDEGIKQAHDMAIEAMDDPDDDPIEFTAPKRYLAEGTQTTELTQAMIYRALRKSKKYELRPGVKKNLPLVREEVERLSARSPTDDEIWKAIMRNRNISRNVRVFLWKCMHEGHRVGPYWLKIAGYEYRSVCSNCDESATDTMDHILFRCKNSAGNVIWKLAEKMCDQKGIEWPSHLDIYTILAAPLTTLADDAGKKRPGATRLYQILVTEAAYEIWKARNKAVIPENGEPPKGPRSEEELTSTFANTLNRRIWDDRLSTNRRKYGTRANTVDLVLRTWSGILHDEDSLPENWIHGLSGVLVGITPRRRKGRNR